MAAGSFLSNLQTSAKNKPSAMLIYSMPGGGKTSLGAMFPKCIFGIDDQEDGINDLKSNGMVRDDIPVSVFHSWQDVLDFTDELVNTDHPYKWLILDSATGLERLLHAHVTEKEFGGDSSNTGFLSFGKGYSSSVTILNDWILKLEKLREKGMGVVLLAHSKIKAFNDPINGSYDRVNVDVHEKTYSVLSKWMTIIGYIEMVISVKTKEGKKDIAIGGDIRLLHLTHNAAFDAKNRSGITQPINLGESCEEGFKAFTGALKTAKANSTHKTTT